MSDVGEGRKCAGNTLNCESFEMFVQTVEHELSECRARGTIPQGYSDDTLQAWNTLVQSEGMSCEDVDLIRRELRRSIFENEFRAEDTCPNVCVDDKELPELATRYEAGFPDCKGLSDRIGRLTLVDLPGWDPLHS